MDVLDTIADMAFDDQVHMRLRALAHACTAQTTGHVSRAAPAARPGPAAFASSRCSAVCSPLL